MVETPAITSYWVVKKGVVGYVPLFLHLGFSDVFFVAHGIVQVTREQLLNLESHLLPVNNVALS